MMIRTYFTHKLVYYLKNRDPLETENLDSTFTMFVADLGYDT